MTSNKAQFQSRKRSHKERGVDVTAIRQRFLIVCEGTKTEVNYFRRFHAPGLVIQVEGTGMNTLNVVDEALRLSQEEEYDQVWCVFDKDDFALDRFENAIHRAGQKGFYVAYSNQSFELWFVLHFEYLNTAINRSGYMKKLDNHLRFKYDKKNTEMYQILKCKIETAIQNAERLLKNYDKAHSGQNDPSTTVHELVKILLEQGKPLG
ncbi:MAG: RloB family protein [Chloroflexota bacterium]